MPRASPNTAILLLRLLGPTDVAASRLFFQSTLQSADLNLPLCTLGVSVSDLYTCTVLNYLQPMHESWMYMLHI